MSERDHDTVAAADEAEEVALGLRGTPRGTRRPLRFERVALARRELAQLDRAVERRLEPEFLHRGLPDFVRLPHEIECLERRYEIVWDRRRLVLEPGLDQIEAPLRCRVDDRLLQCVERALRERREGADGLDLVSEELEANRLPPGGGKGVHDSAP